MKALSVRKLLLFFVLALLSSVFCASAFAAAPDKHFRVAVSSDPTSLDPQAQLAEENVAYSNWCFDPLLRWTKDMKLEGRLAEKWEQIDPLTYRFHLRKGVKFHSGNPMTAKDVAWTLARMKTSPDYKALFEPFGEAKVVDDNTIDLVTTRPYGLVLNMVTYLFVMDSAFYTGTDERGEPKDQIKKTGPSFANANVSGTGPFMLVSREQGVHLKLKNFPDYWGPHGNVATFELQPIKTDATRVASLLSNAVDMIYPVPTQDYDRVANDKNLQFETMPSSRVITIQMNQKRRPELANIKVREAIIAATDTAGIVQKIMRGRTITTSEQIPPDMDGYVKDLKPRYNLERAQQLMKEAGYEKGLEFSMIAPNNRYINDEKIAEAFVSMMAKINIKISLKTMPRSQYWDEFDAQVADIQMVGWHPDTEDAGNYTEYLMMCPDKAKGYGAYNSGNYCNKKVDELALACQSETDPAKRTAMLQEIERILYNDAAYIPLHFEPHAWGANKKVKNFTNIVNPFNHPRFGDLVME